MYDPRALLGGLAFSLAAVLVLGACSEADEAEDATQATTERGPKFELVKPGTLTACTSIPYEPFEFRQDATVVGIDVDLVTAIAKELGLAAEFHDVEFARIFRALAASECDLVASAVSATDDAERTKNNDYSDSYFAVHQSLLIRKAEETTYRDLVDLRGKTVGVQAETTGEVFAERNKAANGYEVRRFGATDEMYAALSAGEIAGIVQDSVINLFQANKMPQYVVAKIFGDQPEEYAFVIPERIRGLKAAVDKALATLRDSGSYDRILEKYLGPAAVKG